MTVAEARTMPDEQLVELFAEMVVDLWGTFGDDALPETFPRDPYEMTREDRRGDLSACVLVRSAGRASGTGKNSLTLRGREKR